MAFETSEAARVLSAAANSADVDALRFTDGRLDPKVVSNVTQTLAEVSESLGETQTQVEEATSPWLLAPIASRMDDLDEQLSDNLPDVETALGTSRIAEGLLGSGEPRRYLVLFTTPVEARGRTGFPGNYAELLVDDGQLSMPRFGRITELEQGGTPGPQRTIPNAPPDYMARYARFEPQSTWRNITLSPDFPTIARVAGDLYPQSGGTEVQGVMSVDPSGLAALMRLLDLTIPVAGLPEPLTADNTVSFLQCDQYVALPGTSERVDLLENVAEQTFKRSPVADMPGPATSSRCSTPRSTGGTSSSRPSTRPRTYFNASGSPGSSTRRRRRRLGGHHPNAGGNKIDLFLQRSLQLRRRLGSRHRRGGRQADGDAAEHRRRPAGLPDYVIGNAGRPARRAPTGRSCRSTAPTRLDGARSTASR